MEMIAAATDVADNLADGTFVGSVTFAVTRYWEVVIHKAVEHVWDDTAAMAQMLMMMDVFKAEYVESIIMGLTDRESDDRPDADSDY